MRYIFSNIAPKVVVVVNQFGGFDYLDLVQRLRSELRSNFSILVKGDGEGNECWSLDKLMNEDYDISPDWAEIQVSGFYNEADAPCLITHTSGSTGQPKGAMHTHNTILTDCKNVAKVSGTSQADVFLNALPMCHQFGLESGTTFASVQGAKVVLLDSFIPSDFLRTIETERATFILGVPTMFKILMQHPDYDKFDLGSVRSGLVGGGYLLKS